MRVFINGRFLTQRVTGVQRYALETLRAMDNLLGQDEHYRDWQVTLLTPPGCNQPSLNHIEQREVGRGDGQLWEQCWLPLYARSGILLGFSATGPLISARQVVTIHDASVYAIPHAFDWRFRAWYKLMLPWMAHRNRSTMTVSEFSKGELVRYLKVGAGKLHVSGEGWQHVTRCEADDRIIKQHRLTPRGYILAVSSVSKHKNFGIIAQAMKRLTNSDAQVVVAGAANQRIFRATDSASGGAAKYVGYVSDEALRALYENAAAFVYPSRYEGFGLPPLEAMALGCPVICSTAASMPEVCQDAVLYFEPDDASRLAELMAELLHDRQQRERLIAKGKALLERHSWGTTARKHLELIRSFSA